jgi:hypothetical protein
MKQEEWAERLNNHLKDYQQEPTRDLWEGIEASLDKQARGHAHLIAMRRWLIAAAIIGIMFGGTYLLWHHEAPTQPQLAVVKPSHHAEQTDKTPEALTAQADDPRMIAAPATEQHIQSAAVEQAMVEEATAIPQKEEPTLPDEKATLPKEDTPSPQVHRPLPAEPKAVYQQTERQQHEPLRLTIGLFAQGNTNDMNSKNGVMMNSNMMLRHTAARAYLLNYEERESHDQPVSFGLSMGFKLNKWLSVGTGVVYTKLHSTFTTLMPNQQIVRNQKLHYLGVPLNLQAHLLQWHGIGLYLTAGGQADWNIKAEANTDGIDQVMTKDRLQWSVGGSLGVEYRVIPQLSLYAEPGIRHYFDNGSDINNYFKDKPTSFNLQLGLRFNFNTNK